MAIVAPIDWSGSGTGGLPMPASRGYLGAWRNNDYGAPSSLRTGARRNPAYYQPDVPVDTGNPLTLGELLGGEGAPTGKSTLASSQSARAAREFQNFGNKTGLFKFAETLANFADEHPEEMLAFAPNEVPASLTPAAVERYRRMAVRNGVRSLLGPIARAAQSLATNAGSLPFGAYWFCPNGYEVQYSCNGGADRWFTGGRSACWAFGLANLGADPDGNNSDAYDFTSHASISAWDLAPGATVGNPFGYAYHVEEFAPQAGNDDGSGVPVGAPQLMPWTEAMTLAWAAAPPAPPPGSPQKSPPYAGQSPPKTGTKEVKFKGTRAAAALAVAIKYNATTEFRDAITAMWYAIPVGKKRYWGKPTLARMSTDVFANFFDIEWGSWTETKYNNHGKIGALKAPVVRSGAAFNLASNALQDMTYGILGQLAAVAARRLGHSAAFTARVNGSITRMNQSAGFQAPSATGFVPGGLLE